MSFMVDDVLSDSALSNDFRSVLENLVEEHPGSAYCRVLVPTEDNNDIDGSQHHSERINFTYEDASYEDILNASSLGFYENFSNYDGDTYTGNIYDGTGHLFAAVVVNPPNYAVDYNL